MGCCRRTASWRPHWPSSPSPVWASDQKPGSAPGSGVASTSPFHSRLSLPSSMCAKPGSTPEPFCSPRLIKFTLPFADWTEFWQKLKENILWMRPHSEEAATRDCLSYNEVSTWRFQKHGVCCCFGSCIHVTWLTNWSHGDFWGSMSLPEDSVTVRLGNGSLLVSPMDIFLQTLLPLFQQLVWFLRNPGQNANCFLAVVSKPATVFTSRAHIAVDTRSILWPPFHTNAPCPLHISHCSSIPINSKALQAIIHFNLTWVTPVNNPSIPFIALLFCSNAMSL